MKPPVSPRYLNVAQTALRIAAGLAFFSHGAQKLFGWFGGVGPNGAAAELMSRYGAAGIIETVAGICLVLGMGTRWVAFVVSGEMAVAYFWIHSARSGSLWWWANHGELPLLYSFIWLTFAAWGAGPVSVDAWMARRRMARGGDPQARSGP